MIHLILSLLVAFPVTSCSAAEEICIDRCGDGICQEMVCQGSGCPCGETKESCPRDCRLSS